MKIEWRSKYQFKHVFSCYSYKIFAFSHNKVEPKGCHSTRKSNSWKSNKLSGIRLPGGIPVEFWEDSRKNCWWILSECQEEYRVNLGRNPGEIPGEHWKESLEFRANPERYPRRSPGKIARRSLGSNPGWIPEEILERIPGGILERTPVNPGRNAEWIRIEILGEYWA